MLRSAIRLSQNLRRPRITSHQNSVLFFSSSNAHSSSPSLPPNPNSNPSEFQQKQQQQQQQQEKTTNNKESESFNQTHKPKRNIHSDYQTQQLRVLQASLSYVNKMGWSEGALIAGARDAGISPSIVGSFDRKEAALVEYFMDDCLQRLIDEIDSGLDLTNMILSERLAKLIQIRLEMQAPYVSKWPQALSIQAQPMNLPTSFKQRAMLIDEIWDASGDQASDVDWYVKRTVLGGIYSTSEVYMVTDHSPGFSDTWSFLNRRIKDAFDLQKSFQEATYLAEAVGAGMGNTLQGFMKKVLQR